MVIRLLYKNTLMKIKKSFGRYISLFIIVVVGVGFFSGLKQSSPDIIFSVDKYYKECSLMDFKIVSNLGLTEEDVNSIKSLKNISNVVPSYSLDVLSEGKAVKIQAIEKSVNTVNLIKGRMPKNNTECVADSKKYKLGDKITLTNDTGNKLKNKEFTVVGTVNSPLYMSSDYGNTTIGDGKLYSFIFVNKDNFNLDAYTEIYATSANTKNVTSYSKEYDNLISSLNTELTKLKPERESARYQEIYNRANNEINLNQTKLNDEKAKGEKKLADLKSYLDANTNKNQLDNGYSEYNKNLVQFNAEISSAQAKIDNAKNELLKIEKPKWYIYDRDNIPGYSTLKSGTDTITSVAAVFPIFFILIVILMTSNTMARMIVEERNELGTLTSLGFKNNHIISTYLLYVLSATVLGAVTGFFSGSRIIPNIIFSTFSKFILPPMVINYDIISLLFILIVSTALMTGVTLLFCRGELKQNPAALMRPIPPKHGQRILLERVRFIWCNLSFSWKVTMRNIFRYKQKVFMTIVGVAGCTALLVAGFGLRDSIDGVAEKQYGEIFKYNATIVLKNETQDISKDLENLFTKEKVENPLLIKQSAFQIQSDDNTLDTYLIVPEDENLFEKYYDLTSNFTGENVRLNDSEAVITQKLAETLKVGKGSTIKVKDANNKSYSVKVSDVAENYIKNYIYMNKNMYNKVFGEDISYNMIVSNYSEDEAILTKHLLDDGSIVNVTFKEDIMNQVQNSNKSLNNVIIMLVVIASILVVIVLYNLTSINISERNIEIATLKVLGFTDRETNQYIYHEAFIVTIFAIGLGMLLGIGFHRFVIGAIEDDSTVYFKNIHLLSFIWSSLVILIVSVIMQVITYFKIQTINMIESLKSVE